MQRNEEQQELSKRNRKNTINNEVFTLEEACEYLSISKSSLYKMNMVKTIPFYKPKRKVYYKKSDLDKYLNSNPNISIIDERDKILNYFNLNK